MRALLDSPSFSFPEKENKEKDICSRLVGFLLGLSTIKICP